MTFNLKWSDRSWGFFTPTQPIPHNTLRQVVVVVGEDIRQTE